MLPNLHQDVDEDLWIQNEQMNCINRFKWTGFCPLLPVHFRFKGCKVAFYAPK